MQDVEVGGGRVLECVGSLTSTLFVCFVHAAIHRHLAGVLSISVFVFHQPKNRWWQQHFSVSWGWIPNVSQSFSNNTFYFYTRTIKQDCHEFMEEIHILQKTHFFTQYIHHIGSLYVQYRARAYIGHMQLIIIIIIIMLIILNSFWIQIWNNIPKCNRFSYSYGYRSPKRKL